MAQVRGMQSTGPVGNPDQPLVTTSYQGWSLGRELAHMAEPRVLHWHVVIEPFPAEMMYAWNFEISPALLRDSLGYRLFIREQTSGELLVLGVTATLCF